VKRSGNYDPTIREWETKPKADQTFIAFRPFIVREYSKTTTRKLTAQATGYGIANHVDTVTPFNTDTANLVLETTAEIVNPVSAQNNKKLEDLIKLQTETFIRLPKTTTQEQFVQHRYHQQPSQPSQKSMPSLQAPPSLHSYQKMLGTTGKCGIAAHWKSLADRTAAQST
jgi:hypothetical protein